MEEFSWTDWIGLTIIVFLLGSFLAPFFFPLYLVARISSGFLLVGSGGFLILLLLTRSRKLRLVFFISLALGLGLVLYYYRLPVKNENHLLFYCGREYSVKAWVCQEPELRIDQTFYRLRLIGLGKGREKIRGEILAIDSDLGREFQFGDIIEFQSKLIRPKSDSRFDYAGYLANQDIYALAYPKEIKKLGRISRSLLGMGYYLYWAKERLLGAKTIFLRASQRVLAEPFSAFLAGLLFGVKRSLPEKLNQDFIRTGLIHIVVVSGYNISILIKVFVRYTRVWLPKFSFWLGTLAILLFIVMVGSSPSAVRAGIMAWIILWGQGRGREANQFLLLLVTALIMTFFNPKLVRYDLGFQLSFLAVFGLIYLSPIIEEWLNKIKVKRWLPQIFYPYLIETLAAQTLTIPLILYTFGRISIIAPLANILVLPLIPTAMLVGFLAALITLLWPFLGQVVGWLEWLLLKYMTMVVGALSRISWASIEFRWFNIYFLGLAYLAIFYKIYGFQRREKEKKERE